MNPLASPPRSLHSSATRFTPQANQWVELRDPFPGYGYHQALLLCNSGHDQWTAWIPDHGEALLNREQFLSVQA